MSFFLLKNTFASQMLHLPPQHTSCAFVRLKMMTASGRNTLNRYHLYMDTVGVMPLVRMAQAGGGKCAAEYSFEVDVAI